MMIFPLLIALATFVSTTFGIALYSNDPAEQRRLFLEFKRKHGKSYVSIDEENIRFGVFVKKLQLIDDRNEAERKVGGSAVHGITKFADMTTEEFKHKYLKTKHPNAFKEKKNAKVTSPQNFVLPQLLVDWTDIYTTAVKDQCYCGSCWAFAAVEQIESDAIRTLKWNINSPLSAAQACQCTYTSSDGCSGGMPPDAYSYIKSAGGIEQSANYPYPYCGPGSSFYNTYTNNNTSNNNYGIGASSKVRATNDACAATPRDFVIKVVDYFITARDEPSIANYVQTTGPVQVYVDGSVWESYVGGILTVCISNSVNHAVQAVGVDTASGYWKLRNQWGTDWGENGFIRIAYNQNMCNIGLFGSSYTDVALTLNPTTIPTSAPTGIPTYSPSFTPTVIKSATPTRPPVVVPTARMTNKPSTKPSVYATTPPSRLPSMVPSTKPSNVPTAAPSSNPSITPTVKPTVLPTVRPSNSTSAKPTVFRTLAPSNSPASFPSFSPTTVLSTFPSINPFIAPSSITPSSDPAV